MRNFSNTSLPAKLKMLRVEHGKSQEELAQELGISRSCLANYETGNRQPDNDMLIRIADTFQVMIDYLVDRTEFRNLNLTFCEMNDLTRVNHILKNRGNTLDLSVLDVEGKIAVIQFYDYIETLNQPGNMPKNE